MNFPWVGGRRCLDFAGTLKHRGTPEEQELLTDPRALSNWAVEGRLLDAAVVVSDDDLVTAFALRDGIYRTVTARLERRRPRVMDVKLLNELAGEPQLARRLLRNGSVRREGTASHLIASLAADLLDLFAGPDIDNVKCCGYPHCTLFYVDASRGKNRHWCGMSTCGNRAKVKAFRARQRAAAT
ncbi:CGNR zinc finger domain-containing protein [Mycobacterium paragordonae]|uniref:ABATE domain-containing protein n=1 Tax=Mycobacterium paragordonae TaxID=1389713 RepID=A0A4V3AXN9_9MYCO|nr:ABATE domain-containing protein [Mycobacterium paragordonae]MDP7736875.1 ABATE domain-containing protein [Mycobacterium paragordonae]PJE22533.1 MAG: hypothetical protein CK431_15985 [Mycobacterium sp.]TDK98733.1 hypothetical protein EUA02_08115 [Mycobacterium paragordonae]TDL09056.1 hypothetical protein EUA05_08635 [Mycobacterium paragordonae]